MPHTLSTWYTDRIHYIRLYTFQSPPARRVIHARGARVTSARVPRIAFATEFLYQSTSYRLYQRRGRPGRGILHADERVYNVVYTHRQRPAATHNIIIILYLREARQR